MTESNLAKSLTYDQLVVIRTELNKAKRYYASLIGDDPSPFFRERVSELEEIVSVLESLSLDLIAD